MEYQIFTGKIPDRYKTNASILSPTKTKETQNTDWKGIYREDIIVIIHSDYFWQGGPWPMQARHETDNEPIVPRLLTERNVLQPQFEYCNTGLQSSGLALYSGAVGSVTRKKLFQLYSKKPYYISRDGNACQPSTPLYPQWKWFKHCW